MMFESNTLLMNIDLKTLYELRNVIDTNPSLLNNEKRLEGIFLDLFNGDHINVNRLMKGYRYGIVETIIKNDEDIVNRNKFITDLITKEDMVENSVIQIFDSWEIILSNQICIQSVQSNVNNYYLKFLYKIVKISLEKNNYEFVVSNFPSVKFVNTLNSKLHVNKCNFLAFHVKEIGLCSPDKIFSVSNGEVTSSETINYITLKPVLNGLFCEKIFGPINDYECHCGKYKSKKYNKTICDKCGVEVTSSMVRGKRMGHITLVTPIAHTWYIKTGYIGLILDMNQKCLKSVLYFAAYVVLDPGATNLKKLDALTEREYYKAKEEYGEEAFRVGMGAEAIRELLCEIDLKKLEKELKEELVDEKLQKKAKTVKRLEVVEAFIKSGNRPEWMILTVIPVLPPDIRPMIQLDGGRFVTSDLNVLYKTIIARNNSLAKLLELGTPDIIIRNWKRMLQESVDKLYDNANTWDPVLDHDGHRYESFIDYIYHWNKLSDVEKQLALENENELECNNEIKKNNKIKSKKNIDIIQTYNEFIEKEEFGDV